MNHQRKPWQHDKRSRHERGYGTAWDKLRLRILERDGYLCKCEECVSAKRLRPATQVDHRISKADWLRHHGNLDHVDDPSNLRAINADCHKRKGILEKGQTPRVAVGSDGWPIG